jgi:hypothetical protein
MSRRSVADAVRVADVKFVGYTSASGEARMLSFSPMKRDVVATWTKGTGTAVTGAGLDVAVTYAPGVSTVGALRAAMLVEPEVVDALLLATGSEHDADVLPDVGEPTLEFWRDVPAPPVLACGVDGAGRARPLTAGPENASDDVEIELDAARLAPGVELTDKLGDSLSGTSLTVARLTGEVRLKFDKTHDDLTGLAAAAYGTLAFDLATKKITRTVGDWNARTGGDAVNYSAKGTKVTIAGSVGNDGTYTVVGLGANSKELVVEEALADEVASATETVSGYRPVTGVLLSALAWPASVEFSGSFSKVYAEHAAQAGCDMVLHVGRTQ